MLNKPTLHVSIRCQMPLEPEVSKKLTRFSKALSSNEIDPRICIHISEHDTQKELICIPKALNPPAITTTHDIKITTPHELYTLLVLFIHLAIDPLNQYGYHFRGDHLTIAISPAEAHPSLYHFKWTLEY